MDSKHYQNKHDTIWTFLEYFTVRQYSFSVKRKKINSEMFNIIYFYEQFLNSEHSQTRVTTTTLIITTVITNLEPQFQLWNITLPLINNNLSTTTENLGFFMWALQKGLIVLTYLTFWNSLLLIIFEHLKVDHFGSLYAYRYVPERKEKLI